MKEAIIIYIIVQILFGHMNNQHQMFFVLTTNYSLMALYVHRQAKVIFKNSVIYQYKRFLIATLLMYLPSFCYAIYFQDYILIFAFVLTYVSLTLFGILRLTNLHPISSVIMSIMLMILNMLIVTHQWIVVFGYMIIYCYGSYILFINWGKLWKINIEYLSSYSN